MEGIKIDEKTLESIEKLKDLAEADQIVKILDEMWETYISSDGGSMDNGFNRSVAWRGYLGIRDVFSNLVN